MEFPTMDNNSDERRERADEFTSSVQRLWQHEEHEQQRDDTRSDNPERGASGP